MSDSGAGKGGEQGVREIRPRQQPGDLVPGAAQGRAVVRLVAEDGEGGAQGRVHEVSAGEGGEEREDRQTDRQTDREERTSMPPLNRSMKAMPKKGKICCAMMMIMNIDKYKSLVQGFPRYPPHKQE